MDNSLKNRFFDLLSKKLAGDLSQLEWEELHDILSSYPELNFLYNEIQKPVIYTYDSLEQAEQSYASHYVSNILLADSSSRKLEEDSSPLRTDPGRFSRPWKIAAVIMVMTLGYFSYYLFSKDFSVADAKLNEMITQKGSRSKILLPDGTSVMLNADSRLTYDQSFSGSSREVTLSGEAFFDVMHDPSHPFIIHTQYATIKVLGTSFNVRNYKEEHLFETTLIRGKVEVSVKGESEKTIVLHPNEKLSIALDSTSQDTSSGETPLHHYRQILVSGITVRDSEIVETSWMNGQFSFVNKPLHEIVQELERQFDTRILIENDNVRNYRYTGVFDQSELENILEILKLSKPFDYELGNKQVIIK